MASVPPEAESIEIRARNVIRKSNELIRQTKKLGATVHSLVKKSEDEAVCQALRSTCSAPSGPRCSMLEWTLDSSLRITDATKANVQVFDPTSGDLHILAQHGFAQPFLDFFKRVHAGEAAACGKAFASQSRVFVEDVTESPIFYGSFALEVLLDAGVRAVQSTPLLGSSGAILGMLSTHWSSPGRLNHRALASLDVLAHTVAHWLEHTPNQ